MARESVRDMCGEVLRRDLVAVTHDEGVLNGVFEFAHIAGQGASTQHSYDLRSDSHNGLWL